MAPGIFMPARATGAVRSLLELRPPGAAVLPAGGDAAEGAIVSFCAVVFGPYRPIWTMVSALEKTENGVSIF